MLNQLTAYMTLASIMEVTGRDNTCLKEDIRK